MPVRSFPAIMAEVEALRADDAPLSVIAAAEDALRRAKSGQVQSMHSAYIIQQHAATRQQQNRWGQ